MRNSEKSWKKAKPRCEICNDTGVLIIKKESGTYAKQCKCLLKKFSRERFEKSELANKAEYTFKSFKTYEEWQKEIVSKAKEYVKSFKNYWFYIGGQVGSGKTHICTAILRNIGELNNVSYLYIKCDEELERLKQLTYENQEEYAKRIYQLKNISVLFIDDVLKKTPTEIDKAKLFDIINYRYLNNKACIFSSERLLFDVLTIDEAIGSRIFEKTKKFNIEIAKDINKNFRLKNSLN